MSDPLAPERLAPPTPGQLRRLLGSEGLRPRKSLSQNFLTDAATLDTIVDAAELQPGDRVVEIGPGLGVLTRRLLAAGASVLSVELDARLAAYLRRELDGVEGFELIEADALDLHPREMFAGEGFKVVANIPYHITSPLLHAFLEGDRLPELTVLLVQAGFRQRRKQIHNGLGRELQLDRDALEAALEACNITPDRRPQTLSVDEWAQLSFRLAPGL